MCAEDRIIYSTAMKGLTCVFLHFASDTAAENARAGLSLRDSTEKCAGKNDKILKKTQILENQNHSALLHMLNFQRH